MEIIRDGKGRGYTAEVDGHNRLSTFSTMRPRISFVSEKHQSAFMVYAKRDFVAGDTDENILCFTYTGSTKCFIDRITFSTNSTAAKIEVYGKHTYISGGTERSPLNINRSSGLTSDVTSIIGISGTGGELILSYLDVDEILDVRLSTGQPTFTYDFGGGFILGRNDNMAIIGSVANPGDKIRASVYYFEEPGV